MSRDIKFTPETPKEFKAAIEQLVEQNGVSPENLDGVLDKEKDGQISKEEFIHFVYTNPDWQKYLQAIDKAGLRHPLDIHRIPKPILDRINQLKEKIDSEINLKPQDPGYCDAFVPKFYEAGLSPYVEGGLAFSYPFNYRGLETKEMTASEAYKAVLNPNSRKLDFGSCTEATYKIVSAFLAAGVPCEVKAIATQNHLFARYKNEDLDPSELGKIGWQKVLDEKRLATGFYEQARMSEVGQQAKKKLEDVILAIDPQDFYNDLRKLTDAIWDDNEAAIFEASQSIVSRNPHDIGQLIVLSKALIFVEDPQKRIAILDKILSAFPDNAYILWAVSIHCTVHKCLQSEGDIQNVNSPSSGNAEYLWALEQKDQGNLKKYEELLEKALGKNPNNALALQAKASLLLARGEISDAEKLIQKAIKSAPNLPGNYGLLSNIAMGRGDNDKVYEYAKKEHLVFVGNRGSEITLGFAAFSARKYEDAWAIGRFYTRQFPQSPAGYLLLSMAEQSMGYIERAEEYAKKALKVAVTPASKARVLDRLAGISAFKGDFKTAVDLAKQATDLDPRAQMSFDFFATQRLIFEGRWEEAKKAVENLKKKYPELADFYAMAASVELMTGESKKAEQDVEKAIRLNPNSLLAVFTRLQLHHGKGCSPYRKNEPIF